MNIETFKPGRYRAIMSFGLMLNDAGCEDIELGDELNIYPPDNCQEMRVDWFQGQGSDCICVTDSILVTEFTSLPDNCLELVREVDFKAQIGNDLKDLKDSFATKEFQQKIRDRLAKFKATYLDWIDKALELIEYGQAANTKVKDDHYTLVRYSSNKDEFSLEYWDNGKAEKIIFSKDRLPSVITRAAHFEPSYVFPYEDLKRMRDEITKWEVIFVHLQSAIAGIKKLMDESQERALEEAKEISRFFS